jgi:hypothetical protein
MMTSLGESKVLWRTPDGVAVRLGNFEIGKHKLRSEHIVGLGLHVVPILSAGGSALIVGLTSRSGLPAFNKWLSAQRAGEVASQLRLLLGFLPVVVHQFPAGEVAAALAGVPDGLEHPNWRSVIVLCSRQQRPPSLPAHIPRVPGLVVRYASKSVLLPGQTRIGFEERGSTSAYLGELVWATANPDTRVTPGEKKLVLDNFVVTLIEIKNSSHSVALSPTSTDFRILHFSWGPPRRTVEVWQAAESAAFPRTLKETVTLARAMEIYEHPGHYILRPRRK